MSADMTIESPLAQQLNELIQPKLVEVGWSIGGTDDSALAEYIILMLVNGKTQDQIASELSGDLLNLGPDDPGAHDFSQWLFNLVDQLNKGTDVDASNNTMDNASAEEMDADMGDAQDSASSNVPTGPKSMRNGNGGDKSRDRRMLGHLSKNMARSNDAPLHRIRPHQGNEGRINSHSNRAPPSGPRAGAGVSIRGRAGGNMGANLGRPIANAHNTTSTISPQQQMEIFKMLETQAAMIAQMAGGMPPPPMGMPSHQQAFVQQQGTGPSLFDRVQQPNRPHQHGFNKRGGFQNANNHRSSQPQAQQLPLTSPMDTELTPAREKPSADTTCRFNLRCTNPECIFAHQSPAAPPDTPIDISDTCAFGPACVNRKCTGRHPSPAQRAAHAAEMDCKFYPNCTNPRCSFRHGPPPCRNGADCTTPDCKFAHVKVPCKFNPCLNPGCTFKHEDGQRRGKFEDKVWVAGSTSERKFVDDESAPEELIVPGQTSTAMVVDAGGEVA